MLTHDTEAPDHTNKHNQLNDDLTPSLDPGFDTNNTSFNPAVSRSKTPPLNPANILSLQRTIGNQATMRYIKSQQQQADPQKPGVQRVLGREEALAKFRSAGKLAQQARHFDNRPDSAPKDTDKGEAILNGLKDNPDNITDDQIYSLIMMHKGKLDWLEKDISDKEVAGGELEQIRKVITEGVLLEQLKRGRGNNYAGPGLGGFFAAGKYSEGISAEQTISKFGLDYSYDVNGVETTPYLSKEQNGDFTPIGIVFYLQGDFTKELFNKTQIPFDPTVIDRFKNELARQEEIITKLESKRDQDGNLPKGNQALLDRAMDTHSTIAKVLNRSILKYKKSPDRSPAVQDKITETDAANKKNDWSVTYADAPYAGTGFAQSGDRMEKSPFKHVAMTQEFFAPFSSPTILNAGAGLYAKGPLVNNVAQPDIQLANWDGHTWSLSIDAPDKLAWIRSNDADRATFFQALQGALADGLAKMMPPVQAVQNQPQPAPTPVVPPVLAAPAPAAIPAAPGPAGPAWVRTGHQVQAGQNYLGQRNAAPVAPAAGPAQGPIQAPAPAPATTNQPGVQGQPPADLKPGTLKIIKKKLASIFKRKKK